MTTLIERLQSVFHAHGIVPVATGATPNLPAPIGLGDDPEWKSPYPAGFMIAINRVIGIEGELSLDPKDPGNWTGGRVNVGELKGTKFGISAASFPNIDIANLTRAAAIGLFFTHFWAVISAEKMPPALAYQALDFAVNSGPETAIRKLQAALGVADDGHWGPITQAAAEAAPVSKTIKLFLAERLDFMRALSNWPTAGKGWAGRIATDLRYGALDS